MSLRKSETTSGQWISFEVAQQYTASTVAEMVLDLYVVQQLRVLHFRRWDTKASHNWEVMVNNVQMYIKKQVHAPPMTCAVAQVDFPLFHGKGPFSIPFPTRHNG